MNIKNVQISLSIIGVAFLIYANWGHDLLINYKNCKSDITSGDCFFINTIILYIAIILSTCNIILIFYSLAKSFEQRQIKNIDLDESIRSSIILSINLLIFQIIKFDFTAIGFYFGLLIIFSLVFIILFLIISICIAMFSKNKEESSLVSVSLCYGFIVFLPLLYMLPSTEAFIRRNINNFNIKSEWHNLNFVAKYDNIKISKGSEMSEEFQGAKFEISEPIDERVNLLNNSGLEHFIRLIAIYDKEGQRQGVECDDYHCYDTDGNIVTVEFPKEFIIKNAEKSVMYYEKGTNKVKFNLQKDNKINNSKLYK